MTAGTVLYWTLMWLFDWEWGQCQLACSVKW